MSGLASFIKRHPVVSYYLLVFVISWGGILIALGPGGFVGATQTPRTQLFVGGPISLLGPTISGLVMTAILYGRPGLRNLWRRLLEWRVALKWYVFALFIGPALTLAAMLALGITPAIVTSANKIGLLLTGLAFGIGSSPIFEELGWTGFATPELRKRSGVLTTGLIMGLLWGVWHYPIFSASGLASTAPPPALFTLVLLFTWLIPFRVLMIWLYDHTHSVLLSILMHIPIVADQFILSPEGQTSAQITAQNLVFTALLWVTVALVYFASRRNLESRAQSGKATA